MSLAIWSLATMSLTTIVPRDKFYNRLKHKKTRIIIQIRDLHCLLGLVFIIFTYFYLYYLALLPLPSEVWAFFNTDRWSWTSFYCGRKANTSGWCFIIWSWWVLRMTFVVFFCRKVWTSCWSVRAWWCRTSSCTASPRELLGRTPRPCCWSGRAPANERFKERSWGQNVLFLGLHPWRLSLPLQPILPGRTCIKWYYKEILSDL